MPLPLMIHSALACLRNARAFPLLPAALASVSFGFVLVRVRVRENFLLDSGELVQFMKAERLVF